MYRWSYLIWTPVISHHHCFDRDLSRSSKQRGVTAKQESTPPNRTTFSTRLSHKLRVGVWGGGVHVRDAMMAVALGKSRRSVSLDTPLGHTATGVGEKEKNREKTRTRARGTAAVSVRL